jgi:hypothetical protein
MRVMGRWFPIGCTLLLAGLISPAATAGGWQNSLKPKGESGPELTLAANGTTNYVVVIPEKAMPPEKKAAQDLVQWLREMTGAAFSIRGDASAPIPTEISIGQTNRLVQAKLPDAGADLGDEGYTIAAKDKRLFLVGGRTRGPINAVYALLEEDLGCRWYVGSEARITKRPTLQFNPVLRKFVPVLRVREPDYWYASNPIWSLRNRTNGRCPTVPEDWGGNMSHSRSSIHTYEFQVPPGKYFKDHPEYFALINGKRSSQQLCETNPDVIRIVTQAVLREIKGHPHAKFTPVARNDGRGYCTCPTCKRLTARNGSTAAPQLFLLNRIGEAIEKDYPDALLITTAYLDTVDPPTDMRPRKNVAIWLCNDLHSWKYPFTCFADDNHARSKRYRNAVVGWTKICDQVYIWDYFVNFSHYLAPMPNMHVLKPSVDFYVAHHVKGIMFQGVREDPGERSAMRCWVIAKLLWDPSRDVSALTEDYVRGYFEDAAEPILEYYRLLEEARVHNMATLAEPAADKHKKDVDGSILDDGGIRFCMETPFLSQRFLNQASTLFDKAESLAESEQIRHRVDIERLPVIYVKLRQGPALWGKSYAKLLDQFEAVARREHITHLREGNPDVDWKVKAWRVSLQSK